MDCDLQDDPVYIHKLIEEVKKGNDIVFTTRSERKHNAIKRFNSWLYNRLFKLFSDDNYDIQVGSLVIFSNRVSKAFLSLKEKDRLYIQFLKWVGYKSSTIKVEHKERPSGTSSYNFGKLISLGIQGWTSHSNKLLKLSTYMGFSLSLISFLLGVMVLIKYLLFKLQPGWPSLIIALLFSTGLILMSIGVAGIYIGKIFEQIKNRPLFIIEEELNLHER
jgi:dolichol-phosphate mannosyltransferase